jgi:hypothetical protein
MCCTAVLPALALETRASGSLPKSRRMESTPFTAGITFVILLVLLEVDVWRGQEFRTILDSILLQSI